MDKHIEARDLPKDLDRVMDEVMRDNTRTFVDRDGTPAVVIMSVKEFRSVMPREDWLEAIWTDARARGLDRITPEEIDAEIDAYRQDKADAARRL